MKKTIFAIAVLLAVNTGTFAQTQEAVRKKNHCNGIGNGYMPNA